MVKTCPNFLYEQHDPSQPPCQEVSSLQLKASVQTALIWTVTYEIYRPRQVVFAFVSSLSCLVILRRPSDPFGVEDESASWAEEAMRWRFRAKGFLVGK